MNYQHSPGRTNQKLQYARVQLETLHFLSSLKKRSSQKQAAQIPDFIESGLVLATCESVAQHLRGAWQALMVEIAVNYGIEEASFDHPQSLIDALIANGLSSIEADQMLALQNTTGGWVSDMLALAESTDRLTQLAPVWSPSYEDEGGELLDRVDCEVQANVEQQLAMLRGCLDAMEGLVENMRISAMEW